MAGKLRPCLLNQVLEELNIMDRQAHPAFGKAKRDCIRELVNQELNQTVNKEQIIYCKDCKNCELHVDYITGKTFNFGYCYHWDYEQGSSPNSVDADDFCSYGELKE